jgi:hypothetical protein
VAETDLEVIILNANPLGAFVKPESACGFTADE